MLIGILVCRFWHRLLRMPINAPFFPVFLTYSCIILIFFECIVVGLWFIVSPFSHFSVRVFPRVLFLIVVQCLHGSSSLVTMSRSKFTNWPRRVWLHHRLVSIFNKLQSIVSAVFCQSHSSAKVIRYNLSSVKLFIGPFFLPPGVILRDSHGVAQVRFVTGNKVLRILKKKGLAPELPEDLYFLIKKAVSIRKHLERNRKDRDAKFRLILVESRIHRLARYYKTKRVLPPTWKYESGTASALVS